ncbi:hypothetical protein JCM9279_001885 [Rhodotorula babjevae]
MTLVEPSSTSTIPTHRRRLSLKTLLNPFRHSLDASAHATRAAQPTSTDPRADEAVSASPLERTSTKASSTAPKKLRRRSLSHLVKPSKPSVTKGERVDDAAAPTSTWAKRTLGHPLPPMPTSHKTEGAAKDDKSRLETARQPLRAEQRPSLPAPPLVIELDVRKGAPSTYSPPPPAVDRPSGGDLPMRTALPFPSRPKPATASAQHSAASPDVKHERVASSSDPPRPQCSANSSQSSQSSVDLLAWRFPTPPLRYHSSPDSSVSSTPSSSPRRVDPTAKLAPASPPAGRDSSRPPAVQHRRPSSPPAEPLERPPPSPSGSLATTTRKPITIRPQLGGPRASASLLAKGIPVPAPAHGGGPPRPLNSSSSTSANRSARRRREDEGGRPRERKLGRAS